MSTIREYYSSGESGGEDAEGEERVEVVAIWARPVVGDVLDIGCCDGRPGAKLRGPSRRVFGVDLNPVQLREAGGRLDGALGFDVTGQWPFKDGSLSAIHMGAVIEHVFDFPSMFKEAARVLRRGGKLWISVPNMACLRHRVEVLSGRMPSWYRNYEHIRLWTVDWLGQQLLPLGLSRTKLRGAHVKSTPVHRMISRFLPRLSTIFVAEFEKH